MLVSDSSSGDSTDRLPPSARPRCAVSAVPPLQVEKLIKNPFLCELVLALGCTPFIPFRGLSVAMALDATHPALLFGEIALRPTFTSMFESFLDYNVVIRSTDLRHQVHPVLAAAVARMSFRVCGTCQAHVLVQELECWMCEANRAIAPTVERFRGVQRLRGPTVLEKAVVVPKAGLPVDAVAGSVIRMEIPAGSLLATTLDGDGAVVRYYRIFAGGGEVGYLRVIRSGACDFVLYVSTGQILAEFPKVPPGFLSWIEFPDASE